MRWRDAREEREFKGQQVLLLIGCSISVIDLVFSHHPSGLAITHTHTHTHTPLLIDCHTECE